LRCLRPPPPPPLSLKKPVSPESLKCITTGFFQAIYRFDIKLN
jgi:hypothetical protein